MIRTFVDSGVLIDAARGLTIRTDLAVEHLADPTRTFITSPYVWLETVPKAEYMRRAGELDLYLSFFGEPTLEWCREWESMHEIARSESVRSGLGALDALHIAAAYVLRADELVTVEAPGRAIYRTSLVKVTYLYQRFE